MQLIVCEVDDGNEEIYVDNRVNLKIGIWILCKFYYKTKSIVRYFKILNAQIF